MVSECCLKMGTPFFGCGLVTETNEWCKITLGFCSCSLKPEAAHDLLQGPGPNLLLRDAVRACALRPRTHSIVCRPTPFGLARRSSLRPRGANDLRRVRLVLLPQVRLLRQARRPDRHRPRNGRAAHQRDGTLSSHRAAKRCAPTPKSAARDGILRAPLCAQALVHRARGGSAPGKQASPYHATSLPCWKAHLVADNVSAFNSAPRAPRRGACTRAVPFVAFFEARARMSKFGRQGSQRGNLIMRDDTAHHARGSSAHDQGKNSNWACDTLTPSLTDLAIDALRLQRRLRRAAYGLPQQHAADRHRPPPKRRVDWLPARWHIAAPKQQAGVSSPKQPPGLSGATRSPHFASAGADEWRRRTVAAPCPPRPVR